VQLAVGQPGVIIDQGMHPLIANPLSDFRGRGVAIPGYGVTGRVKRATRLGSICSRSPGQGHSCGGAPGAVAWRSRQASALHAARHGRMWIARLAGDPPRPPAGPLPRPADSLGRSGRHLAWRRMRTRRQILIAAYPASAPPGWPSGSGRRTASPSSCTPPIEQPPPATITPHAHQQRHRSPTSWSELRVTVQPHPGPSFG
jgi:hypothetical protein